MHNKRVIRPNFPLSLMLCTLVAVLLGFSLPAGAVNVDGLYSGAAPVGSRASGDERSAAFSAAMSQVLLKVTGRAEVLDLPEVSRAVSAADNYVESFSYNSSVDEDGLEVVTLEVKFFEMQINDLLDRNQIPMWPRNRAATLIWVVEQSENGRRQLAAADSGMMEILKQQAEARGIPLMFPLMDLEDRRIVDSDLLWNMDAGHVALISRRYSAESVLVLRAFTALGDEYLGRSLYSFRGQEIVQELYGESLEELIATPVNYVAEQLAAYYAIYLGGTESQVAVQMQVEGINSLKNYAELLDYVNSLADVSAVAIHSVNDTTITLELQTGGQIRQLIEAIALDRHLMPVTQAGRIGSRVGMHYQWRP